jgi:hypothetical protein
MTAPVTLSLRFKQALGVNVNTRAWKNSYLATESEFLPAG